MVIGLLMWTAMTCSALGGRRRSAAGIGREGRSFGFPELGEGPVGRVLNVGPREPPQVASASRAPNFLESEAHAVLPSPPELCLHLLPNTFEELLRRERQLECLVMSLAMGREVSRQVLVGVSVPVPPTAGGEGVPT
jgi:hypothetical protein